MLDILLSKVNLQLKILAKKNIERYSMIQNSLNNVMQE